MGTTSSCHPNGETLERHIDILKYMERYGHEHLVVCHEPSVGLKAFIAIHDTTLGDP